MDLEKAMVAYELSAEWFQGEGAKSSGSICLLKAASLAAQLEQYDKASKIYEQVGMAAIDSPLRFSVRDHFLKAGLCILCNTDIVAANKALARYTNMDSTFASTREAQFLKNIVAACEVGDVEAFSNHTVDFDNFATLDAWKVAILLKIKKGIVEESPLI